MTLLVILPRSWPSGLLGDWVQVHWSELRGQYKAGAGLEGADLPADLHLEHRHHLIAQSGVTRGDVLPQNALQVDIVDLFDIGRREPAPVVLLNKDKLVVSFFDAQKLVDPAVFLDCVFSEQRLGLGLAARQERRGGQEKANICGISNVLHGDQQSEGKRGNHFQKSERRAATRPRPPSITKDRSSPENISPTACQE